MDEQTDANTSKTRTYQVLPSGADHAAGQLRCQSCGRDLNAGYPVVMVDRDPATTPPEPDGVQVADLLCVYCDSLAPHQA